jgi:hypothetical protein
MPNEIKTTGQLRATLLEAINDVRCKHMDVDRAVCVSKLASQANESLRIEIMANRMLAEQGNNTQSLGSLPLTDGSALS